MQPSSAARGMFTHAYMFMHVAGRGAVHGRGARALLPMGPAAPTHAALCAACAAVLGASWCTACALIMRCNDVHSLVAPSTV